MGLMVFSAVPLLSQADGGIARLAEMRGSVLVASGFSIASVQEGFRLAPGARVLTTSNASVVVVFADGCHVNVGPDSRFVVERQAACPQALSEKATSAAKVVLAGPRS
jgi:hypothetical protein